MGRKRRIERVPGSLSCLKAHPSAYTKTGWFEKKVKKAERWLRKNKNKIITKAIQRFGGATLQAIVMIALPEVSMILGISSMDPTAQQFIVNLIRKVFDI